MQVRMMHQVASPSMQNSEEANLRAEVFWIGSYSTQGLGRRLKENVVDHLLVLVSDRCDLVRNSEDNMEVLAVEKFGLTIFDPLGTGQRLALWTMPVAAGPVANALLTTLIALLDLSSESCRTAQFDRSHDASLSGRHGRTMLVPIDFAVAAENVRHFQLRAIHAAP
jgi:hypothetical protein